LKLTVIQTLPALNSGGVERGTIEVADKLVRKGHRSIVISSGGQMLNQLLETGSEHITLPIGKKSLSSLLLIKELRRVIRESEANILHARSRLPAWLSYLAWRKLSKDSRPHFVTSVHGPYSVNRYSRIMTRGERVIAISEFIHNYIQNNYADVDLGKVSIIHRGVDPELFNTSYKPSSTWLQNWQANNPHLHGRIIITLPARITRWKGQQDFINIIGKLIDQKVAVHGLIVGGADSRREAYYRELKLKVSTLGLQRNISFLGHRNDIKEIMSVSNLVMSLAREPEAFGRTALEALALGVPVIAYDHGGASEVLNEMFPSGLVKKHDINAATIKVMQFVESPPHPSNDNPFTLARMLDDTLELYQNLVSDKNL
jgi:glycosyltransferase involved in cell wall biosynthesis